MTQLPSESPSGASPEAPSTATWSIAHVERDTGLGKDTLRVWERRYGFPTPQRDGAGERMYDQEQVVRLRLIKRLIDGGMRPGKVVGLPASELEALSESLAPRAFECGGEAGGQPSPLEDPWIGWLRSDQSERFRNGLQQHVMRHGLAATVEQLVAPLCHWVGESWVRGELSVYQEHLFTEAVQVVLRESISALDVVQRDVRRPPRVLFTTTPGEQHVLGLLMAECFFALEGCDRVTLGPSTPITEIVTAVRQMRSDAVALSFSSHAGRREVLDSLDQLRAQLPETVAMWVGGSAAALYRRALPQGVELVQSASDVARCVSRWRSQR